MMRVVKTGFIGVSLILVMSGCNTDLDSLNPFKDKKLEEAKKEATLAKEALQMNKQCLKMAKSAKEANECNEKAKEHAPKLQLEKFKRWNKTEKKKSLSNIDKELTQAECVLKAEDILSATKCLGGENNTTKANTNSKK